jgi:hypothetical protein
MDESGTGERDVQGSNAICLQPSADNLVRTASDTGPLDTVATDGVLARRRGDGGVPAALRRSPNEDDFGSPRRDRLCAHDTTTDPVAWK